MGELLERTTVGDIVAGDFRTAAVFERFGIDFCCGGRRDFRDACRDAGAEPEAVQHALDALPPVADRLDDVTSAPLEQLIEHIVETHHMYVRSALPAIAGYLKKLVEAHGARHPELARVLAVFQDLRADFEQHMIKENRCSFPMFATSPRRQDHAGFREVRSVPSKTRFGCSNASTSRPATRCGRSAN